jgi:sigma-B regulation protein RsbU (phosphoserine phosphatase)
MSAIVLPRLLVCTGDPSARDDFWSQVETADCRVVTHPLGQDDPADLASHDLVLIDGSSGHADALSLCRRLRGRLTEVFIPILFVTADPSPGARLASLEAGADACLIRPFAPGEMQAQIRAFLRMKDLHGRLADRTSEVHRINRSLKQVHQQLNQELELARRLQMSFLPRTLPDVPEIRFAVDYRLTGQIGGDFYDVFRLDERHVGLYIADAMGHGVPASLLTVFVKKGVHPKEVFGKQYRLVPPGEVLRWLNRDLIELGLSDQPFITMIYVLFNHRERTLHFARAGHPYPLHIPRDGEIRLWEVEGSLLGVFDTVFPLQTQQLQPGDKVLLYSDGIDDAYVEGCEPGYPSLLACVAHHRTRPIQEFIPRVAQDLFGQGSQQDDLTLLGLEVCQPTHESEPRP